MASVPNPTMMTVKSVFAQQRIADLNLYRVNVSVRVYRNVGYAHSGSGLFGSVAFLAAENAEKR